MADIKLSTVWVFFSNIYPTCPTKSEFLGFRGFFGLGNCEKSIKFENEPLKNLNKIKDMRMPINNKSLSLVTN